MVVCTAAREGALYALLASELARAERRKRRLAIQGIKAFVARHNSRLLRSACISQDHCLFARSGVPGGGTCVLSFFSWRGRAGPFKRSSWRSECQLGCVSSSHLLCAAVNGGVVRTYDHTFASCLGQRGQEGEGTLPIARERARVGGAAQT